MALKKNSIKISIFLSKIPGDNIKKILSKSGLKLSTKSPNKNLFFCALANEPSIKSKNIIKPKRKQENPSKRILTYENKDI